MKKIFADSNIENINGSQTSTSNSGHSSENSTVRGCAVKFMDASTQTLLSDEITHATESINSNQMLIFLRNPLKKQKVYIPYKHWH